MKSDFVRKLKCNYLIYNVDKIIFDKSFAI